MNGPQAGVELDGGKYRIVRLLGKGGMGSVFEAENTLTRKRVAIKWMHADLATRSDVPARLLREAQASARVRHPNVVDVYDVGLERGIVFLVMEYLEGEPLTALLSRKALPMHELIALLLPVMRAVAAAHRQGVIHRDLKPDNIFLAIEADTAHPIPKVLDFGISKLEPRGEEQLSLTRSGSTLGTPRYMSYEQLIGDKNIDVRTDVYSLGVILYEALTGQLPYDAESFPELIVKVATQAPTFPKELRADIPTPLARIILWAMARDRDQRIPNVDALINELTPFSTEYGFRAQMTLPEASVPSFAKPDAAPERAARPSAAKSQRPPESIGAVAPVSTVSSARLSRRTLASVALGLGGLLVLALMLWLGASAPTPTLREPLPAAAVVPPLPTLAVEPRAVTAEPESVKASTRLELSGSAREQELDAAAAQALPTALQEPSTSPAAVREGHSPVMRPAGSTRSTSKPPVATKRSERSAALDAAVDAGASAPARATEPRVSAPESPAFRVRTLPKSSDF